jgi:hypothetical protein
MMVARVGNLVVDTRHSIVLVVRHSSSRRPAALSSQSAITTPMLIGPVNLNYVTPSDRRRSMQACDSDPEAGSCCTMWNFSGNQGRLWTSVSKHYYSFFSERPLQPMPRIGDIKLL